MTKQQQKSLPGNNFNVDGGSNNIDSSIGIDNVDKLNWNELRKTIKTYGLSNSGRKIELQQRLKNYLVEQQQQQQQQENKLHGLSTTINEIKEESEEQVVVLPAALLTTPTPILAAVVEPTPEQRSRMEQNRKRALQLRQQFFRDGQKRLKGASSEKLLSTTDASAVAAKPITPVASSVVIKNPYKNNPKSNPMQQKPATLMQQTFTSSLFHLPSSSSPPPPPPPVISTWGDCRMDLWETVCRCGGAREHSPDVRMCRCGAALDAGLVCGCRRGVLLIKSGPRGFFWGCSLYRKEGCKYTKRFGPPYDREAGIQLAHLRQSAMRKRDREIEEWSC
eukprot:scaffold18301_cov79-Skeletonema_menzelii.AAC.3